MEISKQQPMRPAEINLIDKVNEREQTLSMLTQSLDTLATSFESLESFVNLFKIGRINNVNIPPNDSVTVRVTFTGPFDSTDCYVVLAQVITNEPASMFTYTLIDCMYSGFSCSIANSDTDMHTVSLGYIAVKVN